MSCAISRPPWIGSRVLGVVAPGSIKRSVPVENYTYRGQSYEVYNSVALANSGPLQVELIQTRNDAPSMYRDFLAAGHTGLQHNAYWTTTFDADLARLEQQGFKVAMSGEVGRNGRFVYFDTENHPGTVIELSEVAGPKGKMFDMIPRGIRGLGWPRPDPPVPRPEYLMSAAANLDRLQNAERLEADYLVETPLDIAKVAEVMAGEQSCGTFVRVAGESDALRERSRAQVERIEMLEPALRPSLSNAWLERQRITGPWHRARVTLSFPLANIGANLPTLAATVAGNLYDLGEVTGMRLLAMRLPAAYRARFEMPRHGIAGTRRITQVKRPR